MEPENGLKEVLEKIRVNTRSSTKCLTSWGKNPKENPNPFLRKKNEET